MFGEPRIGVTDGNDSVKKENFPQMRSLRELPEKDEDIEDDDEKIDDWKRF